MTSGFTMPDGTYVATIEGMGKHIQRHSVQCCTCSFCVGGNYYDNSRHRKVGRFGITVPPTGNQWKWTSVTWRWGIWQYYLKLNVQLFPSIWPFFRDKDWEYPVERKSKEEK